MHGDLSEYNILVVPSSLVENRADNNAAAAIAATNTEKKQKEALIPVFIDFGQAVDMRHPDAVALLQRDLDRIRSFFLKQGIEPMRAEKALSFVVDNGDRLSQRHLVHEAG